MRKTLITLMALGGVAWAGVDGDWTATFTTSDASKDQTIEDYSASFETNAPLTIVLTGGEINNSGTNQAVGTYTGGSFTSSVRPNANTGNGASYTLNFTLTNNSTESVGITAITLNAFTYNAGGNLQGYVRTVKFEITGGIIGSADVTFTGDQPQSINLTLNEYNEAAFLAAGDSLDFCLAVSKGTSTDTEAVKGTFVGLKGATFTLIPEPASATLSLLALCGLAARRRRY